MVGTFGIFLVPNLSLDFLMGFPIVYMPFYGFPTALLALFTRESVPFLDLVLLRFFRV